MPVILQGNYTTIDRKAQPFLEVYFCFMRSFYFIPPNGGEKILLFHRFFVIMHKSVNSSEISSEIITFFEKPFVSFALVLRSLDHLL